ncbi:UNVERIFIED_CONTAM: hypothetical protein FKN15_020301 [Acipenser sinensis]
MKTIASFLPNLKAVGEDFPNLLGQIVKIYGAVGLGNEVGVKSAKLYSTDDEIEEAPKSCDLVSAISDGDENEKLEVKIQAFEETLASENNSPGLIRRYSLGQTFKEERKEMRFNRSKSLALHAVHTKSVNSENGHERECGEMHPGIGLSERSLSQESCRLPLGSDQDASTTEVPSSPHPCAASIVANSSAETYEDSPTDTEKCSGELQDQLFLHLKENLCTIQTYYAEMVKRIPVLEQCLIEDSFRSCVAKLFFTCSMKGHYCLYSKSSFTLNSRQPQVWIQIILLFHQDLDSVQKHLKEVRFFDLFGHSEETGGWLCFMCINPEKATESTSCPKDLDSVQKHLKEVRFFDLFGHSEETGGWLCFMCINPEKATDDLDDSPIELSKVQSVKVVARKCRDRSLPRAFEIFTDNKTYVLKAKDEKNAEEWLQCINVAVAQPQLLQGPANDERLHRAAWSGSLEQVKALLTFGIPVNCQASHAIRTCSGQTPLHLAAANRHGNVAWTLLEHKVQVDCKDINRWSPLHWVSFNGNLDVIDLLLLLERGATVDAADKDLVTPLHLAAGCGSCIAVHLLMQYGGSVGSTDLLEMTPLHYSALNGFAETAKILLCYGADKNAKERLGKTPLHLASERDQIQVLVVLLKSGADASLQSKWKETAADIAVQKQHTNALRLIQASTKQQTNP